MTVRIGIPFTAMSAWRLLIAGLLLVMLGLPVFFPLRETFTVGRVSYLFEDVQYLRRLTFNTLLLVGGTLAVALPVGTLLAVLLFRSDLPWRRFWIGCTVLILFVPLPLLMSAWTAVFGIDGYWPTPGWKANAPQAWTAGLVPALWVHSLAGIPWVVLIVGNGLCWIERELEEGALLHVGPWRVLVRVTLPRCGASLLAAALWLGLATFGEIGVTNYLQVPTLAEEVQTQFASGSRAALARSVLLALPMVLTLIGVLLWLLPRLERSLPPLQGWLAAPACLRLNRARWPLIFALAGIAAVLTLVPIWSLVWKAGLAGVPPAWSLRQTVARMQMEHAALWQIFSTFLTAGCTALFTAGLALLLCWLMRESRWLSVLATLLLVTIWALPGPVIGLGIKETITWLLDTLDAWHIPSATVDMLLYQGPSPLPIMWAQSARFLPFAVALLWPWMRTIPPALLEAAQLEGAGPMRELTRVVWPLLARGAGWTFLVVSALCLGEVAASNRVETAGWETFANVLLNRLHYVGESPVATLSLLMIGCLLALLGLVLLCRILFFQNSS